MPRHVPGRRLFNVLQSIGFNAPKGEGSNLTGRGLAKPGLVKIEGDMVLS